MLNKRVEKLDKNVESLLTMAWHFLRWMELYDNLDALSVQCMEHCNMEIKEVFHKGSNHKPHRLLKSGKVTLFRTGRVMTSSTLMAHHRDVHGLAHRAQPTCL
eukprot:jgi/Tetstr1/445604/TSEL_003410.t1